MKIIINHEKYEMARKKETDIWCYSILTFVFFRAFRGKNHVS